MKKWHLFLLALIILVAIGLKIFYARWPETTVLIGGREVRVLVADNFSHLMRGWSGRKDMGAYRGMLFVFPGRAQHTMVMRDMYFPLDIIWIDGGTIVDLAPNLPPEPGRTEAQLTLYPGRLPSTMVLELPAGFIDQNKLQIGDGVSVN